MVIKPAKLAIAIFGHNGKSAWFVTMKSDVFAE
jgi:hypothetical protein